MDKKLYRSRTDKTFAGVCGGLGKLIGIDPTIVRVVYALLSFFSAAFPGIILYIILACIIPEEPQEFDGQNGQQQWRPCQAWQPPQEPPQAPPQENPPAGDAQG